MKSISGVVCGLLMSACSTTVFVGIPIDGGPELPSDAALQPELDAALEPMDAMPFRPPALGMPAIGPEFPVDEPINAADSVREPSMACATTRCLVAWRSRRGIVAARIDADGEILDESGIIVAPASLAPAHEGQGPFVFTGNDDGFLVVWVSPDSTLYSVSVNGEGIALAPHAIDAWHNWHRPFSTAQGHLCPGAIDIGEDAISITDEIVNNTDGQKFIRTRLLHRTRFILTDIQTPDMLSGSMTTIAGLAAWVAKPEEEPGRIEIVESCVWGDAGYVEGRRLTIPNVDFRGTQRLALARSGDVLTVAWTEPGSSELRTSLRATRIDLSSFTAIDAEPVVIAEGQMMHQLPAPPVISAPDGVLLTVGDWLRDGSPNTLPAAFLLPATGPLRGRPLEFGEEWSRIRRNHHPFLSVGASSGGRFIGILHSGGASLSGGAWVVTTQLAGPLEMSNRLLGLHPRVHLQALPQVACAESACVIAWHDGTNSWRAVRVHPRTGEALDDSSVELFPGRSSLPFAFATDGSDFLFVLSNYTSIAARRLGADGTLEDPFETPIPVSQVIEGIQISWARESYQLAVEGRYNECFLADLYRNGAATREPIALEQGRNMLITSFGQDALMVYVSRTTGRPVAIIVHEGSVSEPIALPFDFVSGRAHDRWSLRGLVSRGDYAYLLAWVDSDRDRREQRIFGITLDRNAHPVEPVRELAIEPGLVDDLSLITDDAGVVFAYTWRDWDSSPRQLGLERWAPMGAESPRVIFAEGTTALGAISSGIGMAASGPNSLLTAYPRGGRIMGRFVYLPSPGPS